MKGEQNMTDIYVIVQHDTTSGYSNVYSAHADGTVANHQVAWLNQEEKLKEIKYNEWINNCDDDSLSPEFGDLVFTVEKTRFYKI